MDEIMSKSAMRPPSPMEPAGTPVFHPEQRVSTLDSEPLKVQNSIKPAKIPQQLENVTRIGELAKKPPAEKIRY